MTEQTHPSRHRLVAGTTTTNTMAASRETHPPVADWEPRYRVGVILGDVLATLAVVMVIGGLMTARHSGFGPLSILALEVLTVIVVLGSLYLSRVWNANVLGQGAEEFRRLGKGLFASVVTLGFGALAVDIPGARLWVFVVGPVIAIVVFPLRYLLRRPLHRARSQGNCLLPVLAAGNADTVADLISRTRKAPHIGWRVDAICTLDGRSVIGGDLEGVPVVGQFHDVAEQVRRGGYRIVAVTPDAYWTPRRLQQLAWDLEGTGTEMVVAPVLMDFAGPRLHVTGVLGMPLLRVSEPSFTGFRRFVKGVVDRVGATALIALLMPVVVAVAVAIMVDSRGPVFYRQRRVGKDGSEFMIIKFRTMVTNADALRTKLNSVNEGSGLLFKMRKDPRVTKVGRVLRRYSLDELPQLLNVLTGAMSLVGPRPPLPEESAKYGPAVRRRLLVKPGLTGLWQVSGRSDLSWEESVRLDLRYVEDWSLALDALILWKTFRAVFGGQGAY